MKERLETPVGLGWISAWLQIWASRRTSRAPQGAEEPGGDLEQPQHLRAYVRQWICIVGDRLDSGSVCRGQQQASVVGYIYFFVFINRDGTVACLCVCSD